MTSLVVKFFKMPGNSFSL